MLDFRRNPQPVEVYPDAASLARAVAGHFVTLAAEAIADSGRFIVALSGGSTPKALHQLLAADEFASRVDWGNVYVFWGDERCVPPDHRESNYHMARETLLDHVPIPEGNIYRMRGEIDPHQAAQEYEERLRSFFAPSHIPGFDLILLGMGSDGHTASLFPGMAAIHEGTRWVIAHYAEKLKSWRITFTPFVINVAANVTFVVAGSSKAESLRDVLHGPYQPDVLPPQIVKPNPGHLRWMVDAAAAALLSED